MAKPTTKSMMNFRCCFTDPLTGSDVNYNDFMDLSMSQLIKKSPNIRPNIGILDKPGKGIARDYRLAPIEFYAKTPRSHFSRDT